MALIKGDSADSTDDGMVHKSVSTSGVRLKDLVFSCYLHPTILSRFVSENHFRTNTGGQK